MKSIFIFILTLPFLALADNTNKSPLVYINQNIGFNVKGYKYKQSTFPCNMDQLLVEKLISKAKARNITLEAVRTADKIQNGIIPVLAIDVEQLALGDKKYGTKGESKLPKIQIVAALIKSKDDVVIAKHTCAILTLNELTPSSNVLDLGTASTVCSATQKCLKKLSSDVVDWIEPQI